MNKLSSLLLAGIAAALAPLAGARAPEPEAIDTCGLPRAPIVEVPSLYEGDTCADNIRRWTDTLSSYGGDCTIPGVDYLGPDAIYEIVLNETNRVGFELTPLEDQGDFVLALLEACGDGESCVGNSPDFIGNDPEPIPAIHRPAGVYYLYVDSPDPSRCGPYRLSVTGENSRPSADLTVDLTPSADLAVAGRNLLYTLTVRNLGPVDVYGVSVTQTLPDGVELVRLPADCQKGAPGQTDPPGRKVTCTREHLTVGRRVDFKVLVKVLPSTRTSLVTTAEEHAFAIADDTPNTTGEFTPVEGRTDLTLTKAADRTRVVAGESLTYTLTVTNCGPSDSTSSTIRDSLPAGLTFVPSSDDRCGEAKGVVICSVGGLAAPSDPDLCGDTSILSFEASLTPSAVSELGIGQIDNMATVEGDEVEPADAEGPNTANVASEVTAEADLELTVSADREVVVAGETLTYTLSVRNHGPSDSTGSTVHGRLPAVVAFESSPDGCTAAGRVVTCIVGSLARGGIETRSFDARVAASAVSESDVTEIVARATVNGNEPEPSDATRRNSAGERTEVTAETDLELTKSAPTTVVAGNKLTYTLTVSNHGPSDSTGSTLRDRLREGLVFDPTSTDVCTAANDEVTCSVGPLPADPDSFATLSFDATVKPSAVSESGITEIVNTATVEGMEPEPRDAVQPNRDSARTEVTAETDLQLTKSAPTTVVAGNKLTYTLTVRNHGPSDSTGSTLHDRLREGLVFDPTSTDACTAANEEVTCSVGPLPADPDSFATLSFDATVEPSAVSELGIMEIVNTATVEGMEPEPRDAVQPNRDSARTEVTAETDLQLTKSAPTTVVAGNKLTYTLTVRNHGPSVSTGSTLRDRLGEGLVFDSTSTDVCTAANDEVTCSVGPLPADPDSFATLSFDATVEPSAISGLGITEIVNTATVEGMEPEPRDAVQPNRDSATTEVSAETDLELTKTAEPDPEVVAGRNLTYALRVTNHGPSVSTGSTLRDSLTDELSFVSSVDGCAPADGGVTCRVGPLRPGVESPPLRFVAAVSPEATGTIVNEASVEGDEVEPRNATAPNDAAVSSTVRTESDLAVTVIDEPDPVGPDSELLYRLTVSNRGPSDAVGLVLVNTLPEGVAFGQAPLCNQVEDPEDPERAEVECGIPRLAAGESTTFSITGTVDADAVSPLGNEATLSADDEPIVTVEEYTTVAAEGADLAVTQSDSIDPVIAGDRLAYSVTVVNRGPEATSFARLTDCLPAGTVFDEAASGCTLGDQSTVACTPDDPPPGLCPLDDPAAVTCAFDDPSGELELPVGASMSCVITVEVDRAAVGPLVNVAEVAGQDDPNAADPEAPDFNNRSEEETAVLAVGRLVLPFFAVAPDDSEATTLVTVHNGAETAVRVLFEYHVGGATPTTAEEDIAGRATHVVDLRGLGLPVGDLGVATGYAEITALRADNGEPLPRDEQHLAGYAFSIDPGGGFASGHPLVDTDSSRRPPGLCRAWDTGFLNGGGLAGETDFIFFTSAVPGAGEPLVVGEVYTEAGLFVQEIPVEATEGAFALSSRQPEIDLLAPFGAVEWRFLDGVGYVASVFRAGRSAVGLPGFCKDPRVEDAGGDLLLPHFGDLEELAMFLAIRNGGGSETTVDTRFFNAAGQELVIVDAEPVEIAGHATHKVDLGSTLAEAQGDGATTGYVVVERSPGAVLHGDAFRLEGDPAAGLAGGDALVELDPARRPPALCQRWDIVFFNGRDFDDSEFFFFVSESDAAQGPAQEIGRGWLYDESGMLVGVVPVTPAMEEKRAFSRRLDELFPNLVPDLGTLEFRFREGVAGHVSGVFTRGEYSAAVPGICRDGAD